MDVWNMVKHGEVTQEMDAVAVESQSWAAHPLSAMVFFMCFGCSGVQRSGEISRHHTLFMSLLEQYQKQDLRARFKLYQTQGVVTCCNPNKNSIANSLPILEIFSVVHCALLFSSKHLPNPQVSPHSHWLKCLPVFCAGCTPQSGPNKMMLTASCHPK